MFLNIQPDSSAAGAGTRKTDNDARAVGEFDVQALVGRHAAVEIGVGEVASGGDCAVFIFLLVFY